MKVVFTGPAVDSSGKAILRANLAAACQEVGMEVQRSVRKNTEVLVASRTDTVKARKAKERGLPVMTYPQFIATYLRGVEIKEGGVLNPYTDKVDSDLLVPDFTEGQQVEMVDYL